MENRPVLSTTSVLVLAKEMNGLGPWCVCSKIGPGSSRFVVGILLEKMDRRFFWAAIHIKIVEHNAMAPCLPSSMFAETKHQNPLEGQRFPNGTHGPSMVAPITERVLVNGGG